MHAHHKLSSHGNKQDRLPANGFYYPGERGWHRTNNNTSVLLSQDLDPEPVFKGMPCHLLTALFETQLNKMQCKLKAISVEPCS